VHRQTPYLRGLLLKGKREKGTREEGRRETEERVGKGKVGGLPKTQRHKNTIGLENARTVVTHCGQLILKKISKIAAT